MPNLSEIIKSIEEQKARYTISTNILKKAEPILKQFEGKKITARIETAILKEFEGYTIYYGKPYSWFTLQIWGKEIGFDNRISLNLGYKDTFSFEEYVKNNQCYYLDAARYEELENYNYNELNDLINSFEKIKQDMIEFTKRVPDIYPISKYFKL